MHFSMIMYMLWSLYVSSLLIKCYCCFPSMLFIYLTTCYTISDRFGHVCSFRGKFGRGQCREGVWLITFKEVLQLKNNPI